MGPIRRRGPRLVLTTLAVLVLSTGALSAAVDAAEPTGPELSVAAADLGATLECPNAIENAGRDVILLVPGTTVHPRTNFGMAWIPAFEALGYPYCMVHTPERGMNDIQVSSEHVVHAIRELHRRSGRKVDIIGHSQGGTNPRWALRWWPDTRAMVDDYIGIAPSAHGGKSVDRMCGDGDCAPAIWQQTYLSDFVRAMNSGGETFPGIDYTVAWTAHDEFLTPPESTTIDGAVNIKLQDICPANTSEHVAIGAYDPVTFAIAMDALDHDGPADPARLDRAVCAKVLAPYVNPVTFPADYARAWGEIWYELLTYPQVKAEPPLKAYARNAG
jgi:triacylglycerol esterase/lipase EstA (alpha/beta hydrolase family)